MPTEHIPGASSGTTQADAGLPPLPEVINMTTISDRASQRLDLSTGQRVVNDVGPELRLPNGFPPTVLAVKQEQIRSAESSADLTPLLQAILAAQLKIVSLLEQQALASIRTR